MIKFLTKTIVLTLVICFATLITKAQVGFDFSHYDAGVAAGFDQISGNAQTKMTTQSIHFNFTYNYTPFTNFVFEAQLGKLTGGDSLKTTTGRYFNNDFNAFIFRGQLQFGEFIDYSRSPFNNAIKNLYVSAGIGYVVNYITKITRISPTGDYTPGQNSSNEPFVPLRIGYEFKVFNNYQQPAFKVDLGYEYNLTFSDGLDGFSAANRHEAYTQFTIGVKFAIGGDIVSYRKQIHY